ncbi:uncharacterized protein LOC120623907 isoform X2 [Pararge aegeria]|uniref:uncharacterized protein LOC120623907 isoform X2 n=1 Tax=Pararge aegeria TaxID=116150 RepID=UPI0019D21594|nr:uncharacterized protein LOC120623907 isoform X2 [Pararge aegeria]
MAMEHIRQFDWCSSEPDVDFVTEADMDNSVIERILRNKFRNPAISSDSEDDGPNVINWDDIFSKRQNIQFQKSQHIYVPCLTQSAPPYPKRSAINGKQQYQCLKLLCADNPDILPKEYLPPATPRDRKLYEEVKEQYEIEQKEFIAWAKTMWTTSHCVRALHPKPHVEAVYEARFKMRALEMSSYPKTYEMAAQIPLEKNNSNACEMVLDKEIKKVNIKSLPKVDCMQITKKCSIIGPHNVPEPCTKHPCKFILPTENSVSILPLTEVQRELAQFGLDNNAHYVVSENALKCLVEFDRPWDITVAVTGVIGPDGETTNVVVLGSEFAVRKEPVLTRTYQAFRHLLLPSLVPSSEKSKLNYKSPNNKKAIEESDNESNVSDGYWGIGPDEDDDEDDDKLCIDEALREWFGSDDDDEAQSKKKKQDKNNDDTIAKDNKSNNKPQKIEDDSGFYNCTCKDTIFEEPPPRSFNRWLVRDTTTGENYNVIVHCAHKVRNDSGEVILEPIPEYQLELGGSAQAPGRIRSLGLSLHLRKNASLINVRVDGDSGEVATFEGMDGERFRREHGDVMSGVAQTLHTTFSQLAGLRPGNYILRHAPSHGSNAMLYVAKSSSTASLTLDFDCSRLEEPDESKSLKTAPTLVPVLLPFHKFRKILPCAFTPHQKMVAREPRPPPQRKKAPPPALQLDAGNGTGGARTKWPKKNKKKKIARS